MLQRGAGDETSTPAAFSARAGVVAQPVHGVLVTSSAGPVVGTSSQHGRGFLLALGIGATRGRTRSARPPRWAPPLDSGALGARPPQHRPGESGADPLPSSRCLLGGVSSAKLLSSRTSAAEHGEGRISSTTVPGWRRAGRAGSPGSTRYAVSRSSASVVCGSLALSASMKRPRISTTISTRTAARADKILRPTPARPADEAGGDQPRQRVSSIRCLANEQRGEDGERTLPP